MVAQALEDRLGPGAVFSGSAIPVRHHQDMSHLPPVRPWLVVRPRDPDGVAATMRIAIAHNVPIVPQGGLTGLCGGAQPLEGAIALSTERLSGIEALDQEGSTVTVMAGTPLAVVQSAAEAAGLFYPVDLGSRGSCTIGGNIATNAGGLRVIRYGMTRDMVLGLEAVLPDGSLMTSMNRMLKNNAGYDLKQLLIGSEGTLGIVTRAVLRLFPRPATTMLALCAVQDYAQAVRLLVSARTGLGPHLSAFEVMWNDYWIMATRRLPRGRDPFRHDHAAYVLIEAQGADEAEDPSRFEAWLEQQAENGLIADGVLAQSLADAAAFWAIRDSNSEFASVCGPCVDFDIGLPVARMDRFALECREILSMRLPGTECFFFGHIGDGNLHIMVSTPGGYEAAKPRIEACVYQLVRDFQGSISAEHGIGLTKRPWLDQVRSPEELATMRLLKRALDPKMLLNPGKVI